MPKFKSTDLKMVMLVMAGVFGAGYLMNLGRKSDIVHDAISGFDA